ncbi:LytTR family transcriptional regulator DNA-binding domain-containing protein [Flavobacterium sp.]|uniref:LytR/AlgR family response regulator transcription factor n=1 Tax=Flavobacterium sp. TaxID=239 RepID=UPI00286E2F1E|nr:LytTR family transcriptional regulator DNA-binding domain-containing protein [Flavobacterium sp.]
MNYPYIIIDDDQESVLKTKAVAADFSELVFVASANNYTDGLHLILEHTPKIIFLEINPADKGSNLSLTLINELYRFLKVVPKIIITTSGKEFAFEAIQYEVADYIIKPVQKIDLVKSLLKLKKSTSEDEVYLVQSPVVNQPPKLLVDTASLVATEQIVPSAEQPLIICIKSYGDYRYIDARDICYLQADNNSTDIYLKTGEMVTAFKTLKHFEGILSAPFARIHNSYIINQNYISRIHTGNALCYIKNTTTKIPFSKSYKENIDSIISAIANGNYLEI